MADNLKIPVTAEFDNRGTQQAVQQVTNTLNTIGQTIAKANKLQYEPVKKGALEDLKKIQQQFEALQKVSGGLRQRLTATGQNGKAFSDIDWEKVYPDPSRRARAILNAFNYSAQGTSFGDRFQALPGVPAPGGGGGGGGGGGAPPVAPPPGGGGGGRFPGQGIVNAGLNAAGPIGRAASGGLNAGMSGGLMAGLGAFGGILAATGVAKIVGSVMDKLGDAEQESIGVDNLKRMLGDVGVSFKELRDSVRNAAEAMNTNYNEALRLSSEFSRVSGVKSEGEVRVGGGLARALGLNLEQGVGAFAQMRASRVTGGEQDARRLALLIGEAVGRVGFAKADELLAVVTQYTAQQTRQGMAAANVGGYLGGLSSLAGSGRPGLDVGGAAALLSRANSSIVGGGSAGEAGQNFLFATLGRQFGLSPVQARVLQQQGLFGTGQQAFGSGSLYAAFSKRYGGNVPGAAANSGAMNIDAILGGLEKQYGGSPDMMASAAANLLGLNESQAMAVMLHGRGGALGGIEARLKRSGVGLNQLSDTGIAALAQINSGGSDVLQAQAQSLRMRAGRDSLSADERKRLDAAMASGNVENMRDVLTELTATREQEMTEGKATRDSIEGVARETQKFATMLIPIANTMRDGIVAIAAKLAPDSEFAQGARQAEALKARDSAISESDDELAKHDALIDSIHKGDKYKNMSRPMQEHWDQALNSKRDMLVMKRNRNIGHDGDYQSMAEAMLPALIGAESSGNHYGPDGKLLTSQKGAQGITQVMPKTGTDPGFGVKPLQDQSEAEYKRFARDYLAAMLRRYQDKSKALAAYNWGAGNVDSSIRMYGDKWLEHAPGETQAYVAKNLRAGAAPMSGEATVRVKTVDDKTGKPIAAPVTVKLGKPAAAGASP